MKVNLLIVVVAGAVTLALSGCVKEKLYEPDPPAGETGKGELTITPDWTMLSPGVERPSTYILEVGDYIAECTGDSHTPSQLFDPGTYKVYIYNKVDGITVADGKVRLQNSPPARGGVPEGRGGGSEPTRSGNEALQPLLIGTAEVVVEADGKHPLTVPIQQQTSELVFVLEATDRVEGITATLTGLAGAWNIDSNQPADAPVTVELTFEKITEGHDAGKFRAIVRILGTIGSEQQLQLTITYNDGTPPSQPEPQNLNELLTGVNNDKSTPISLETKIEETPVEPTPDNPAGFTATINGWTVKTGSGVAN